jgi:hypothetical protein
MCIFVYVLLLSVHDIVCPLMARSLCFEANIEDMFCAQNITNLSARSLSSLHPRQCSNPIMTFSPRNIPAYIFQSGKNSRLSYESLLHDYISAPLAVQCRLFGAPPAKLEIIESSRTGYVFSRMWLHVTLSGANI